jgi:hypothetical protein
MASDVQDRPPGSAGADEHGPVEMPRPTVAPMVVALGLAFALAGLATSHAILAVGAVILIAGLAGWVGQLLPGQGHVHQERAEERPGPVRRRAPGTVQQLEAGVPGYRLRLPVAVHPTSAGIRGGLFGGVLMILPALAWGVLSGHGIWYPVNLLAGMVLPGLGGMTVAELEQFRPGLLVGAVVIHAVFCVVLGLCYGVLLPTLPDVPAAVAWGGLLMPLLWTAVSYGTMRFVNPVLAAGVDWPWFIASQFVFGITSATMFLAARARWRGVPAGLLAGVVGGLVMPVPAFLWGLATRHGVWYPVNLLAGMVVPGMGGLPAARLEAFHATWLAIGVIIHATLSLSFGLAYALVLPRLRPIPAPMAWGGLVLPMLWTGSSYGLMGVVNPVLRDRVDWPWFIASQFVFGVAAAVVVIRTEMIHVPPAGTGPAPEGGGTAGQEERR